MRTIYGLLKLARIFLVHLRCSSTCKPNSWSQTAIGIHVLVLAEIIEFTLNSIISGCRGHHYACELHQGLPSPTVC